MQINVKVVVFGKQRQLYIMHPPNGTLIALAKVMPYAIVVPHASSMPDHADDPNAI